MQAGNKKIIFVIDTLQLGGAEQSLLANTSRFKNTESIIVHPYKGDALKSRFEEAGKKVYSLNISRKYGFLQVYRELKHIVQQEKPDLIVAYLTRSEIVARFVAKKLGIPVIGTFVNDLYTPSYNQHLSWKARKLVNVFKTINKFTSRYCAGFVANSKAIKDSNAIHLGISPEKIEVINRGRDSMRIRRRDAGNLPDQRNINFVNVSRLFTVKGHKQLIEGFKKFTLEHPDATLTVVGDGPLRAELSALIASLQLEKKVILLGARKDVPEILADYDCFVFPSIMEGFSGALVEALFAELPVLATDIPQNQEIIHHQHTGYVFGTSSADEVYKAMSWYKNNMELAHQYAAQGYDYAIRNFELNNIVDQFETYLHKKILNNP
ncbi:MAG: glycosyltransferase [Chitinophagaceae bacterium]|nr:MAG: glycosyltransferase [Chitinophagaceae bacterium]